MILLRIDHAAALRWVAVVPAALIAVAVTQRMFMGLAGPTLSSLYATGLEWVIWAVKSVASVFMGAAFTGAAAWTAPNGHRGIAILAVAVVLVWAVKLSVRGPDIWGLIMGGAGALVVSALVWRTAA